MNPYFFINLCFTTWLLTSFPFCMSDSFCISMVSPLVPRFISSFLSMPESPAPLSCLAIGLLALYYTNHSNIITQCTNILQHKPLGRNLLWAWVCSSVEWPSLWVFILLVTRNVPPPVTAPHAWGFGKSRLSIIMNPILSTVWSSSRLVHETPWTAENNALRCKVPFWWITRLHLAMTHGPS